MIGRTLIGVASALALLTACGTTDPDPSVEVTVHGTVSDEGGGPLAEVAVQATAFVGACGGSLFASERDSSLTSEAQYEIRLVGPGAPFHGCVVVEVFNDDNATVPAATHTLEGVSFGRSADNPVRIDVVLQSAGR